MDDELVLLTSYFNLAGGRRHDNADTFRVDPSVQSATSPDGVAALYVVTEASSSGQMGARARRLVGNTVAWEYATHGDVPPAARLKAALRTCHEEVLREFEGHVSVGASVITVERDTIYLAQVSPGQVYVLHEGRLHSIAANVDGTSPFARALGSSAGPKVTVFRDEIAPRDVLALTSSWFHRAADTDELRECFGAGTSDDIAGCILELAKQYDVRDSTVIVIEAALAKELEADSASEEPPGFLQQVDMAVASLAGVGRMLWDEFRTVPRTEESNGRGRETRRRSRSEGLAAAPSEVADNGRDVMRSDDPTMEVPRVSQDTVEIPAVSPREPDADRVRGTPTEPEPSSTSPEATTRQGVTEAIPAVAPADLAGGGRAVEPSENQAAERNETANETVAPRAWRRRRPRSVIRQHRGREPEPEPEPHEGRGPSYVSELDQVNARIQSDPEIGDAVPPIQAFPDTSTEPSRIYATSKDMQAVNRRPRRFGGVARPVGKDAASSTSVIRPGALSDIDLREPISRPAPSWLTWLGAVACFVLFAVAIIVYVNHRHHAVAVNPYPSLVQKDLQRAVAAKTPNLQDYYLARAQTNIGLAVSHGTKPAKAQLMRQRLQATTDRIHRITREYSPVTVSDFGKFPGARPTEIAISPGPIFVLDVGRKSVFSVTPNSTSNPALVVQAGETDNGFNVDLPQHIATAGGTALVLDDHSVLVRANGTTKTATSLTAGDPNQKTMAMANYGPDVYILDPATSQIWRYLYGVSGFNPPPQAFFTSNKPSLTHSVAFTLDNASVYILQSDGSVRKYDLHNATPQPFALHLRVPLQRPAAIFTDTGLNYVWIADPANARIVQLDKLGRYNRTYRSANPGMSFQRIQSIGVGPNGNTLYVLSGSRLYSFPVVR